MKIDKIWYFREIENGEIYVFEVNNKIIVIDLSYNCVSFDNDKYLFVLNNFPVFNVEKEKFTEWKWFDKSNCEIQSIVILQDEYSFDFFLILLKDKSALHIYNYIDMTYGIDKRTDIIYINNSVTKSYLKKYKIIENIRILDLFGTLIILKLLLL